MGNCPFKRLAVTDLTMPIPTSEAELVELFRQLGAIKPEEWAHSQVSEGIPQLLRFLFLKSAWSKVAVEGETEWIDREIAYARSHPGKPFAGLGVALANCRTKGVSADDLNEMARCLQAQMLFSIAYLLEGPPYEPGPLEDVSWGLFQLDEHESPIGNRIGGLHESVLSIDPTGREMRPRSTVPADSEHRAGHQHLDGQ